MTYKQLIKHFESEVKRLYKIREDKTLGEKIKDIAFGNQMGILYCLDYLKHKKEIEK